MASTHDEDGVEFESETSQEKCSHCGRVNAVTVKGPKDNPRWDEEWDYNCYDCGKHLGTIKTFNKPSVTRPK